MVVGGARGAGEEAAGAGEGGGGGAGTGTGVMVDVGDLQHGGGGVLGCEDTPIGTLVRSFPLQVRTLLGSGVA